MEVEDAEVADSTLSLCVFQSVRTAQQQHGLRHNDYTRYRRYCARKLQRVHKALKLQQGRGKFVKRTLEPAAVTEVGHLLIPLTSAERAWALAMECKSKLEKDGGPRKRLHSVRRLAKAAAHAAELARLATAIGDARTGLEAQAYAAHMAGLHLMEKADERELALAKLERAQDLCIELAKVGSFEQQAVAQQRLDEIEPALRYVKYQLSRTGDVGKVSANVPSSPTAALIQAKISELAAVDATALTAPAAAQSHIQWRGATYTVLGERVKGHLGQAAELAPLLEKALQSGTPEEQLELYERIIKAFAEAKGVVRHTLTMAGGGAPSEASSQAQHRLVHPGLMVALQGAGDSGEAQDDLKALNTVVSGKQLEHTIQRNLLLALQAQESLDGRPDAASMLPSSRLGKSGKIKKRGSRPLELVRLYDILLSNVKDLSDLAGQLGGAAGEYLLDECAARAAEYQAQRCFFLAHSYLLDAKPLEAFALFVRAGERAAEATSKHEECARPDAAALQALERLEQRAAAWRCVAHAETAVAEQRQAEHAESGIGKLAIASSASVQPAKFLLDSLNSWQSFAGSAAEPPRLVPVPQQPASIAVRPFMLDSALGYIKTPYLEHRVKRDEKKSTFGRLFNVWGK